MGACISPHRPPPKSEIPNAFGSGAFFPLRPSFRAPSDFKANLSEAFPEAIFRHRYHVGKVLGEGITGSVFTVKDRESGQEFAMKTINTKQLDPRQLQELSREIALLKTLDHPNIVRLIETYESKHHIRVILELCAGGDCSTRKFHSEAEVRHTIAQVAQAIAHCHFHHIVHRDLKLENVLFTSHEPDAVVKVVDFAMSTLKPKPLLNGALSPKSMTHVVDKNRLIKTTCGTAYYMAPEMLDDKLGGYSEKVDTWALGVLTYIILIGEPPFVGMTDADVFRKIKQDTIDYTRKEWTSRRISSAAMKFVKRLLTVDPAARPSAKEVLCDPWLQADRVAIMTKIDPKLGYEIVDSMAKFFTYPKLRRAALMFLAKYCTDDEVNDLREFYVLADLDMTGSLSLEELTLVIERFAPEEHKPNAKNLAEQLFDCMDLDQGHTIGYMEYLASVIECRCELDEKNLEKAFDHLDTDRSGHISIGNLRSLFGARFTEEEMHAIIMEAAESVNVVPISSPPATTPNGFSPPPPVPLPDVLKKNSALKEVEEKGISKRVFMRMMLSKNGENSSSKAWEDVANGAASEGKHSSCNEATSDGNGSQSGDVVVAAPPVPAPLEATDESVYQNESVS